MQQFEHNGILYEEMPDGQARVIGPAGQAPQQSASPMQSTPAQSPPAFVPPNPNSPRAQEIAQERQFRAQDQGFKTEDQNIQRQQFGIAQQGEAREAQMAPPKFAADLIGQFKSDPAVKGYREALPVIIGATQAQPGGAGDLSVVYGWAKAMDPNSVVREGEVHMAETASGALQRAQHYVSKYRLQEGGSLPPKVRGQLIEEMRTKGRQLNLGYSQVYKQTAELLRQAGIDPSLLGPHEGDKYAPAERQYVEGINQGRAGPTDPNYMAFQGEVQPDRFAGEAVDVGFKLNPQQQQAYDSLVASGARPEQLQALIQGFGGQLENAEDIGQARDQGAGFVSAENAVYNLPENLQGRVDERLANTGTGGAAVAGGADTLTMGTFDELSGVADAFGDVLQGQPLDIQGNIAANRQFQRELSERDPAAYIGGQIAGGFFLPTFGAKTAGQLAGVGAGYGAAYGAGSGEGAGNRTVNALMGGTAGAGIGYGLGRGAQYIRGRKVDRDVPPLVGEDGRLNEPLEVAGPAERVAAAKEFGIDLPMGAAGDRSAAIMETGFDISPASAGLMNDTRRITEGQVSNAVEGVADRFGKARTLNEAGGAAQDGARAWVGRFEATAAKAYDAIPISGKAQATVQNTVSTIDDILGRFSSNPELAQQMNSPKLQQIRDAISKGLSWEDLKALRSRIGYEIGEQRFSDSPTKDDLRAVYGALSEDMRSTAANMGPRASRAFDRANTLYRQGQERIDKALVTILGNDGMKNPEAAARSIQAMTQSKGGDLKKLAQLRASLSKTGEWDEVASALIRLGGQPAKSEGRNFAPETFVRWYSDMTEQARSMMFKPELRKNLDEFVAVNQRLAAKNSLRNTSNTAPGLTAAGAVAGASMAFLNPLLGLKLAGGAAVNFALAKLWTQPKFVQWATGYSKAVGAGNQNAAKAQIGRLSKIATTNPALRGVVTELQRSLLKAANDNASQLGRAAASPDEGPEGQR